MSLGVKFFMGMSGALIVFVLPSLSQKIGDECARCVLAQSPKLDCASVTDWTACALPGHSIQRGRLFRDGHVHHSEQEAQDAHV